MNRIKLSKRETKARYPEIDLFRGLAITAMVVYHGVWNLHYFGFLSFDITSPAAQGIARTIGSSFLLLVGMSLHISWCRWQALQPSTSAWRKFGGRGLKIWGWALLVSTVTWFVLDGHILFGVLHLIGSAVILSPLFLGRPAVSLAVGVAVAFAGLGVGSIALESPWLLPWGIGADAFYMVDYYPLIPWLSPVLIGLALASVLYPSGRQRTALQRWASRFGCRPLAWLRFLGRHSLAVYLVHQPILFTLTLAAAHINS